LALCCLAVRALFQAAFGPRILQGHALDDALIIVAFELSLLAITALALNAVTGRLPSVRIMPVSLTKTGLSIAAGVGAFLAVGFLMLVERRFFGESSTPLNGTQTGYLLYALSVVIIAPSIEELIFRGWILENLLSKHSTILSICISAAIFAAAHGSHRFLDALAAGAVFGMLYTATRNLSTTLIAHVVLNALGTVTTVGLR